MSFSDYQSKLAPGWLQGQNGAAKQRVLGAEKDLQLDVSRQAVLTDFPATFPPWVNSTQYFVGDRVIYTDGLSYVALVPGINLIPTNVAWWAPAPSDFLPVIGSDRDLPPSAGETDVAYAERLRTSWDAPDGHAFKGSHGALLKALARGGFPATGLSTGAVLVQRTKRYSYLASGAAYFGNHSGWTFDTRKPDFWNQFGIIFGADVVMGGIPLDVGTAAALRLDALVKAWKPAKALYMGCWIEVTGPFWGWPFGVSWGAGRVWGGTVRFIPPL